MFVEWLPGTIRPSFFSSDEGARMNSPKLLLRDQLFQMPANIFSYLFGQNWVAGSFLIQ